MRFVGLVLGAPCTELHCEVWVGGMWVTTGFSQLHCRPCRATEDLSGF